MTASYRALGFVLTFWLVLIGQTWAACSSYKGLAVINEVFEQSNGDHFVEVKLLATGIPASTYNNWTVRTCRSGNVCSSSLSLSGATRTGAWLVLGTVGANNIELNNGMDVILRDSSGNTIDYMSMESYTLQRDMSCTPDSDWQHTDTINNTKNIYRDPDGTGNWVTAPGNSAQDTEGGDNSILTLPPGAPTLSVSDATAVEGSPLTFTFTLSAAYTSNVTINYQSVDGSATAGSDYITVSGSVTILAGNTSTTVTVITIDTDKASSEQMYLRIDSATNASVVGAIGIGTITAGPAKTCFTDNFNRVSLGSNWTTVVRSGGFTPSLASNRFQLTQASGNQATGATLQKLFPGSGNQVLVDFRYYAYNGNGADGVAVTFSDASSIPTPGSFGGSLGYAQRNNGDSGFVGGWVGIGLDEYGNFSNPTEGRIGGVGFRQDAVTVRGSGSGSSGYNYISTTGTLSPGIDQSGSTAAPGHRYRISLDSRYPGQSLLTIYRDTTGTGSSYSTLIGPVDMLTQTGQAAVPANFFLTLTGSTGGSTNIHSFDDFQVCADQMNNVGASVDHFELSYAAPALTCEPQDVTIRACADASCSTLYTGSVTTTLSPSGWVGGDTKTFTGGSGAYEYQRTTTGSVTLGVSSATPSASGTTLCRINGTAASTTCLLSFDDSGLAFDVPNLIANKPSGIVKLRAVKKSDTSVACVPAFANVTRDVGFYSGYANPASGTRSVSVNSTSVGQDSGSATALSLAFDASGEADINVSYPDAGQMQLNATYSGSVTTGDTGLSMTGNDTFVSRPAGLCVSTASSCAAGDISCPVFARAGRNFDLSITAVGWESDADTDFCSGSNGDTPNYAQSNIPLTLSLVSPATGTTGSVTPAQYSHVAAADATTTTPVALSEVGVFTLTATPPAYFGEALPAASSANIGRIIPDYFELVQNRNGALNPGCATGATPFAWSGQTLDWLLEPQTDITAHAFGGGITANYTIAPYQRLSPSGIDIAEPVTDNATTGTNAALLPVSVVPQPGSLAVSAPGVLRYEWSSSDTITYPKSPTAEVAAFTPALTWAVDSVTDADGVLATGVPHTFDPSALFKVRYGRLRLENTYGPETSNLIMPMLAEYFDGTAYALNTAESCWSYDTSTEASATGTLTSVVANTPATQSMSSGVPPTGKELVWAAPGAGNTGTVTATYTVPDYLKFDWDNDGTDDDNPSAKITFGQYRGNDRIIYWREVEP